MPLQPTIQQPSQRHILIVEDDVKIADMLANYLLMHGFAMTPSPGFASRHRP